MAQPVSFVLNVTLTPVCAEPIAPSVGCCGTSATASQGVPLVDLGELTSLLQDNSQDMQKLWQVLWEQQRAAHYLLESSKMFAEEGLVPPIVSEELEGFCSRLSRVNADFGRVLSSLRTRNRSYRKSTFTCSSKEETSPGSSSAKRRMKREEGTFTL